MKGLEETLESSYKSIDVFTNIYIYIYIYIYIFVV